MSITEDQQTCKIYHSELIGRLHKGQLEQSGCYFSHTLILICAS